MAKKTGMKGIPDLHRKLSGQLARLVGVERKLDEAEGQIHTAATKQLQTMPKALSTAAAFQGADVGGGVLGHRRHRVLLDEQVRLNGIVHGRGAPPKRGDDGE